MSIPLKVQSSETGTTIIAYSGGRPLVADNDHPNFSLISEAAGKILTGGEVDEADFAALFDATERVITKFAALSERVKVVNDVITIDNDPIEDVYGDQIMRFLSEGVDDWKPLVAFLEKVYTNNEAHTRENLSRWLSAAASFTITESGNILGYKGLRSDRTSVHAGPGIVNGEAQNGNLRNDDGSVVEMQRSQVEHNPSRGCAAGLHVGTWDYASGFGEVVVEVEVNPRDVVSVPTDCGGQKMRVCRYTVLRACDSERNTVVIPDDKVVAEDFATTEEAYDKGFDDGYEEGYDDGQRDADF